MIQKFRFFVNQKRNKIILNRNKNVLKDVESDLKGVKNFRVYANDLKQYQCIQLLITFDISLTISIICVGSSFDPSSFK